MKEKDLHMKQQEEMQKQRVASDRNQEKKISSEKENKRDRERRDVANEERPREPSKGRP